MKKNFMCKRKCEALSHATSCNSKSCDELHTLFTKWPPGGGTTPGGATLYKSVNPSAGAPGGVPPPPPHHPLETSFEQLFHKF